MDRHPDVASRSLSLQEQRTLASFLAGRLPAGQLESELARARGDVDPLPAPVAMTPVAAHAHAPALSASAA